jgi:hypothetical protein
MLLIRWRSCRSSRVHGLPGMVGSVSGADQIGLAIQPRLDLRDPIPPLTSDMNGSRAATGGAQVVDDLRSDADTISRDVSRPPVMERCDDAKHAERHLWPISGH